LGGAIALRALAVYFRPFPPLLVVHGMGMDFSQLSKLSRNLGEITPLERFTVPMHIRRLTRWARIPDNRALRSGG
jgi:hypothetical protein